MNLLLFTEEEAQKPLAKGDPRFDHIKTILKSQEGDTLLGGIINKSRGQVLLKSITKERIEFTFSPSAESETPLAPLTLIIGCPRPPTARRMVKDLVSLGVGRLIFSDTDLNEKSYLQARFWRDEIDKTAAIEGAMQGKSVLLPPIDRYFSLKKAIESLPGGEARFVPDLVKAENLLDSVNCLREEPRKSAVIAIGPERGWTDREREMLAEQGFAPVTLGTRVLRTESAATLAAGVLLLALGR